MTAMPSSPTPARLEAERGLLERLLGVGAEVPDAAIGVPGSTPSTRRSANTNGAVAGEGHLAHLRVAGDVVGGRARSSSHGSSTSEASKPRPARASAASIEVGAVVELVVVEQVAEDR